MIDHPIAVELLTQELERLLRDHFDTPPTWRERKACEGCVRARAVKAEIESLAP